MVLTLGTATGQNSLSLAYLLFVGGFCSVGVAVVWAIVTWERRELTKNLGNAPDLWAGRNAWFKYNAKYQYFVQSRSKANTYVGLGFLVVGVALLIAGLIAWLI